MLLLASPLWLVQSTYTIEDQYPMDGSTHKKLGSSILIINPANECRISFRKFDGVVSQVRLLFPENSSLCQINKNKQTNTQNTKTNPNRFQDQKEKKKSKM